jgi:hypothetical protein
MGDLDSPLLGSLNIDRRIDTVPVEAMNLSFGSRSIRLRRRGVRSLMTQSTSNGASLSASASSLSRWSVNTVISARRCKSDQSAIAKATP